MSLHLNRCSRAAALAPGRALALVVMILVLLIPAPARAVLVDHIAAAVNNDVITASELAQTVALNRLLGRSGEQPALETETLQGIITRRLLVQEAHRLMLVEVSGPEVDERVDNVRQRFGSDAAFAAFLKSLDLSEQELARMLGEQLLVQRFVEKKVGLFVRVTREEAEAWFNAHAAEYRGEKFPDVQKEVMAALTDNKIGQQLDQYVAELRAKADIRINP